MARPAAGHSISDVTLRDVSEADLPIFFAHQLDPVATQMAAFAARDRDAFMAHWTRILSNQTLLKQTVLVDGHVAGNVVSFEESGQRLVGYWIGREYWGKGVATRALSAFLTQIRTRPLYAHVAKHNAASVRVLEKCGFTITGGRVDSADAAGDGVEEFILQLS